MIMVNPYNHISCNINHRITINSYTKVAVVLSLVVTAPFLFVSNINDVHAQSDNNWFVGKGAQENTYYTYKIQHHDVNQGRPFLMTIYLKEFNEEGQYWIAPAFIVDQGKVINGTFHLSALDMSALGSSDIPSEMAPYRSGYSRSMQWLASFVPKPGQSLTAPYWGKIAAIGGEAIAPKGNAKVNTGTPEEFGVLFMDNSQNILNQVNYGFEVTSSANNTVIEDLRNQKAPDGTGVQTIEFPQLGPYNIEVNVEAVPGSPMGMFVESASFGVVVE
jgi:hypothetical protein